MTFILFVFLSCNTSKYKLSNDPKIKFDAQYQRTNNTFQNKIISGRIKYQKTVAQSYENGIPLEKIVSEYFYDSLGNEFKVILYDSNSEVSRVKHKHYDSLGQVILEYIEDVSSDTIYRCTTEYYPDSSVETCIPYLPLEVPHYNKMSYDQYGRDSLLEYNTHGSGYSKIVSYLYNKSDQLIEYTSYWGSGEIASITKFLFYKNDSCTIYYHKTKNKVITKVCPGQTERTYRIYADETINVNHLSFQIQKGGYLELSFNELGLITLWEYFDAKGQLIARIKSTFKHY